MIAGRYTLEREIGRGGTGVVWLGRDEVLGRKVALKRIGMLPGADSTDLARAEREARLSAHLNHAHVVAVFDTVVDADTGAHWLVMEYVDGPTLAQLVEQRGRLSPEEAAPLLGQVADALVAAHSAGIVHRDVKPSNVLVERSGEAKLTDFGIARITTDPSLTQTGMVTGSPAYLAPEVATGTGSNEAADVWSLGATAFHVLAGRPPYEIGDHVLGALYRIVNEEPPRLDAGWMTPLLEGTMVRDPERRWTMEQVRDFLLDPTHPVPAAAPEAHPQSGTQPLTAVGKAPARHRRAPGRLLVAAAAVVALLVLAGVLYAVFSGGDQQAADKRTPPPSPTPSASATATATPAARPTAAGMESFIRDYVRTVGTDPERSWQMLTPKFQRESGGFEAYRRFWDPATNGRVVSISADPSDLVVSYQVRFDNFNNGPGPTVLQLKFDDGRYLIDGELSEGFEPAE